MPTKAQLLEALTAPQLRQIAEAEGIQITRGMTKSELVELLARKLPKDVIAAYVAELSEKPSKGPRGTIKRRQRKGMAAQVRGEEFEKRVARWLKRLSKDFNCEMRVKVRGKVAKKPYEVDIHAWRKVGILKKTKDLWIECKAYKVRREHVFKLRSAIEDVKEEQKAEWHPDVAMIVSSVGFDDDAVALANKYGIYCVHASERGFQFVGNLTKEDFLKEFGL